VRVAIASELASQAFLFLGSKRRDVRDCGGSQLRGKSPPYDRGHLVEAVPFAVVPLNERGYL
jgi:hypothetical protein